MFVREGGAECSNKYSGCANADYRVPGAKQGCKRVAGFCEGDITILDTSRQPMDLCARQAFLQAARQCAPVGCKRNQSNGRVYAPALPLRCSKIVEKYGAFASPSSFSVL